MLTIEVEFDKAYIEYAVGVKHEKMNDGFNFPMDITLQDHEGNADCEISSYRENFYIRPRSACKKAWKGYKDVSTLKSAVTRCLKARGFYDIFWIESMG